MEASLQINFSPSQDRIDPYWLRMELVEKDNLMTVGEAANIIDELYHTSICGESTPLTPTETGEAPEPLASDWTAALQKLSLPSCEALDQMNQGNPGGYEVDIKVFRSHQTEIYKLILSNGYASAPRRTLETVELTLTVENQSSIALDTPIYRRPHIAWTDIDGPDIHIMGNTLYWEGSVTGTIRAEFGTVYDLIHIRVTGTQTPQHIIEGTVEDQWLGVGFYSGSEEGTELTEVQDIQCSALAFYHFQYEELILNKPSTDDDGTVDSNLESAICMQQGSTTVEDGDDDFDPDKAIEQCKANCAKRYKGDAAAIAACQKECVPECVKHISFITICVCGGDRSIGFDSIPTPCPPGVSDGSSLGGTSEWTGGTRFIDCGPDGEVHDATFYEQKCCESPGDIGLPACEEHHGPFTNKQLDDDQKEAITTRYGADAKIIMVGPLEGSCGETITTQDIPSGNCCEGVSTIIWDYDESVEVIADNSFGMVEVQGGQAPYSWKVRGTGFAFNEAGTVRDAITDVPAITIYTKDSCGNAWVTVTDGCSSDSESIRSTEGQFEGNCYAYGFEITGTTTTVGFDMRLNTECVPQEFDHGIQECYIGNFYTFIWWETASPHWANYAIYASYLNKQSMDSKIIPFVSQYYNTAFYGDTTSPHDVETCGCTWGC